MSSTLPRGTMLMDGLAGTIGRPILTSAGIEPHHFGGLAVIKQVTLVFPPLKRADLLMGDPFSGYSRGLRLDGNYVALVHGCVLFWPRGPGLYHPQNAHTSLFSINNFRLYPVALSL